MENKSSDSKSKKKDYNKLLLEEKEQIITKFLNDFIFD
jgi:hypothetical protein